MQSIIFAITASLFVLSGCASLEPTEINTKGNTIISLKNPSVKIEIPLDFEYLGTVTKHQSTENATPGPSPLTTRTEREFHFYGQLTKDNYLHKFISIAVLKSPMGTEWAEEPIRMKKPLQRDCVELGRKRFQCCIKADETTDTYSEQYFLEKAITTPKCYILMLCKKVFGKNVKVFITYYEDVSKFRSFEITSCLEWYNKMTLNEKQKEFLKSFEKRALNSIRVF